jgi:hypothetical protein
VSDSGKYVVYVRDAAGCTAVSDSVNVSCIPVGRAAAKGTQLAVYPNPTQGSFKLQVTGITASQAKVELIDILGKTVSSRQVAVSGAAFSLQLEAPAPGIYFVRVVANGQQYLQRVVRN